MQELTAKILTIGGGPGGYVAAIRAGQLGLDTVLVEKSGLGGTCLNIGCIPSKAIIHAAEAYHAACAQTGAPFGMKLGSVELDFMATIAWKDGIVSRLTGGVAGLLKKAGVRVLSGIAELQDGKTAVVRGPDGDIRIRAEHLVLATGSHPIEVPVLPFGGNVISSKEALSLPEIPATLAVVGAGYIGLELGMAFAQLGSKVTIVEASAALLPAWDADLTRPVQRRLEALGVELLTGAVAEGLSEDHTSLRVRTKDGSRTIEAAKVLVAAGRRPTVRGFGLERLDLKQEGGFIAIDDRSATSMRNVWAIGDVTGEPMLAHRAMAQGEMVAELIAGHKRRFDPVSIPAICFTDPEIVSVGLTPDAAKAAGIAVETARFPFAANGRAMTQGDDSGFVRVIARAEDGLVLGIQAVGHQVSELAAAFSVALEMGATREDLALVIQAHPSRGEALQEAALSSLGRALHV